MDLFAKRGSARKFYLAKIENCGSRKIFFFADSEDVIGLTTGQVWTDSLFMTERIGTGPYTTQNGSNTLFFYFKDEDIGSGVTLTDLKQGQEFYLSNMKYIDAINTIAVYEISSSTNIRESKSKKRITPKK